MASNPPSRVKTRSPIDDAIKLQTVAPVRLKVVVRRLPPNLPETVFWQTVEQWVSEESASWKVFYQGKLRKKLNKENIPSRAYILFKREESLTSFSRGFDGHLFRDKQGNESQAVVEFAPNQKVPPEKRKADTRHATILQDEDYLSFIAALQNPQAKATEVDVDALLAATQPSEEPKTTPLLAALREQKSSAQEKKLAAAEALKAHSRKATPLAPAVAQAAAPVAAAATMSGQRQEVEEAPRPKRTRRGRRTRGNASTQQAAPDSATPPTQSKAGTATRTRPASDAVNVPGVSAPVASSAASASTSREPLGQGADEASQRRNRPMLGLQSRQVQAALNGAGVAMPPPSPSASTSSAPSAPAAVNAGRAAGGPPRAPVAGPSAERQDGGGASERTRTRTRRHGPGPQAAGLGPQAAGLGPPPRILSRQESATALLPSPEAMAAPEAGASRVRSRRGRGPHR